MPDALATHPLDVARGEPRLVAEYLSRPGVLREGHFRLLSGMHTDTFVAFSRLANDPLVLETVASWLYPSVGPLCATAVAAPSTAGVSLGGALAERLGVPLQLALVDEEVRAESLLGNPWLESQRVLLVNDLVTTGRGLLALRNAVAAAGGEVAGAAWFLSRADVDMEGLIRVPAVFVGYVGLEAWSEQDCDLCRQHAPIEDALDLN